MRFLIVLFYFFMLSISAQNYYKDFDPALKLLIDEGDACFKQNQSDCQGYLSTGRAGPGHAVCPCTKGLRPCTPQPRGKCKQNGHDDDDDE